MKPKTILIVSVLLNVVLLGGLGLLIKNRSGVKVEPKWVPAAERGSSPERVEGSDLSAQPNGTSETVPKGPPFRWSQVESEDYAKYVRNLRSVGCPERTIRDIVAADVNALFEPRYAALLQDLQSFEYWRSGMTGGEGERALRASQSELDRERQELMREILGEDYADEASLASLSVDEMVSRSRFGFLSSEKQSQVASVMDHYESRLQSISLDRELGRDDRQAALAEAKEGMRTELELLLSEKELFEFDLRDSHAATSLRRKLGNYEVSEEEFRRLFSLRQDYESAFGETPDYSDPSKIAERSAGREGLEAAYRDVLGEERYVDLQRKDDAAWQALSSVGSDHSLDRPTMEAAYQLQKEARAAVAQTLRDADLDETERAALVEVARAQYDREVAQLVGPEAAGDLGPLPASSRQVFFSTASGNMNAEMLLMDSGLTGAALEITGDVLNNFLPANAPADAQISVLRIGQPTAIEAVPAP